MRILLILLTFLPSLSSAKDITYFDYKFTIPDEYKVIKDTIVDGSNGLFILITDKKVAFSVEKVKKKDKRFFPLKEYGAKNHRELFYTLYSDRPSNNEAVLDVRRIDKLYPLQKRSITENDNDFVFFRTDNSMGSLSGTTYLISTPINDEVILLGFSDKINEKFIKSVIDSLDVK
jgi:hypothetical protein